MFEICDVWIALSYAEAYCEDPCCWGVMLDLCEKGFGSSVTLKGMGFRMMQKHIGLALCTRGWGYTL